MSTIMIAVRIPLTMLIDYDTAANNLGISRSELVRMALTEWADCQDSSFFEARDNA